MGTAMSLMKRFYTDRYFLPRYFLSCLLFSACLCLVLYSVHSPNFYEFHFALWNLALIPLGIYVGGLSVIWIHNATHGSFRKFNSFFGHLAGMHQLWGFTNWKLMHFIHHQYSDDPNMDPHPPRGLSFWQYCKSMASYSIAKINDRYFEQWGKTPYSALVVNSTFIVFLLLGAVNLLFWYLLLGPEWFLFFYLPSYFFNQFFFMHINYFAHPKDKDTGLSKPGNLNHNFYYKLANALWFGIYYHGNHHRYPMAFNPMKTGKPI